MSKGHNLFDLNHDGKMDGFEKAAEFATFMSIMDEEEKERKRNQNLLDDFYMDYKSFLCFYMQFYLTESIS